MTGMRSTSSASSDSRHWPLGMTGMLFITGDPAADQLLQDDPLALLVGMLFDQQVPSLGGAGPRST